ncbi:MAG: class I SAM-dependent methyltransferase, partial [Actinomycetia bacterium]|nr:class I SAM-dependent methyltransferase [Actinomycetes bacterium]
EVVDRLPTGGRALDVAGGTGGTSLFLVEHGLETTLVDISPVALDLATAEAHRRGLALTTIHANLESEPLPEGPFDVIVCANYLDRTVFSPLVDRLSDRGLVLFVIATVTNLERNPHPRRDFLADRGELGELVGARVEPICYSEDWFDGRHEARYVGIRA